MARLEEVSSDTRFRFGPFEADLKRGELRKFGSRIRLERKPWLMLLKLLERPGQLIGRAELQASLWPEGTFVDFEHGLNVAIKKLRAALCDAADAPRYIETVAGEGYRFIAAVEQLPTKTADLASPVATVLSATVPESSPHHASGTHAERISWSNTRLLLAGAAILVSMSVFAAMILMPSWTKLSSRDARPSRKLMLVVLPFQNLSNDPSQDYFSDGITEELSTQLGNENPGQLGVIGRTSAMIYKHSQYTISQIGKELNVDYILEGSVRRDGNQVRITAQLVKTSDQAHLWAANYDENFRDILRLETDISAEIARQVGVSIAIGQAKGATQLHTPNPEAHEAYLRGRYYWYKRNTEGWKKAEEYFRLAILKDSEYAAAYAGLAECLIPKAQAQDAALKATSLDPSSGEAYAALGWVEFYYYLDPVAAGPAFRKAIELAPNHAIVHYTFGQYLSTSHADQGMLEIREAARLDPLSPVFNSGLAGQLASAGRLDDALKQLKIVFELDPQFARAHGVLGDIYTLQEKYSDAIAEYQTEGKLGAGIELGEIGYAYARSGDRMNALKTVAQLQKAEKIAGENGLDLALVEVGLGNNQKAIDLLQKSYDLHEDDGLLSLQTEWRFKPLRADPRFQAIVSKMNFPP